MDPPSSEPEPTPQRSLFPPSPGPSESGRRQHGAPVLLEEHPKTQPVPIPHHSEGLDALTRAPPSQLDEHRPREQSGQHDELLSLLRRRLHDLTDTADVFVSKLQGQSDRVQELTKMNTALEGNLKEQKDEISRIKAQLRDAQNERALFEVESKRAVEAKLEEKDRELARLLGEKNKDLASLQWKLDESEKQVQARVEEGKQQLAVVNTERGDLRSQIETLEAQCQDLKKDLEAQKSRVNALETERQQLAKEAEESKQASREEEPEQNLSDVRVQLVALEGENAGLRENVKMRESRIHGLKKRVREVELEPASPHIASKTSVPQQHDTPGLDAHALAQDGNDLDAAQRRITDLEKQSITLQQDLQHSETEQSRLRLDLSKADELVKTYERGLRNERQENEDLRSQIAQLLEDLRQKGDDLKAEKSRCDRLQADLRESVADNERLNKTLVDLEGRAEDGLKAHVEAKRQRLMSQSDRDAKFTAEIEKIRAKLQDKNRQVSNLETQRDASLESDARMKREIGELHEKLHDADLRHQQEKKSTEKLLSQNAVLESKQKQLIQQVHHLTSDRGQAQSDVVSNLQQEIATRETQIQLLGTRLKDIQGFAFDLKRNAARRKADDAFIRDRLEYEFRDGTRHWAKTWGANKFTAELRQSDKADLRVKLQTVAEVRTDERLVVQLEAIDPRLMVDALLSRYLVDNIFLESSNAAGRHDHVSMESALSKFLIELYKAFMHVDEPNAHSWRSQTLELFRKSELAYVAEEDSPNKSEGTRDWYGLAQQFLTGPVRFFLKPVPNSEQEAQVEQLVELMSETADLALYIRRQYTALQIRGFEHYQGRAFHHDSPEMELDRYHRMDPDDSSRDGDRIRMVVKPGFFAPGPANGESKVWAKAVLLLL